MFPSRYMPCPDCGASLDRQESAHECERERWLAFQLFQLRGEVSAFDDQLAEYLATAHGRFELYYSERERARRQQQGSADSGQRESADRRLGQPPM
jgi:hypothetical protein